MYMSVGVMKDYKLKLRKFIMNQSIKRKLKTKYMGVSVVTRLAMSIGAMKD
jgi:hypothetical protein